MSERDFLRNQALEERAALHWKILSETQGNPRRIILRSLKFTTTKFESVAREFYMGRVNNIEDDAVIPIISGFV